jgi:hypothetical protein
MNDPIVEEVRQAREAHAARFHYDLDAIFRDVKEQEKKSGRKFVSFPARRNEPSHPQMLSTENLTEVTAADR